MDTLLNSNKLDKYTLWKDGSISVDPSFVYDYIEILDRVHVTEYTPDILQYNKLVKNPLTIKTECNIPNIEWTLPLEYQELNILEFILHKHQKHQNLYSWTDQEYTNRNNRLVLEYKLFNKKGLSDLIKTLIYIINTLSSQKQVWGTGRGSSVSSYLLYVIGLHDVDSYEYDLDITDFIKMEKNNVK